MDVTNLKLIFSYSLGNTEGKYMGYFDKDKCLHPEYNL